MRSNIFGTDQSSIRLQLKKMTRLMGVEETSDEVATAKATPQRRDKLELPVEKIGVSLSKFDHSLFEWLEQSVRENGISRLYPARIKRQQNPLHQAALVGNTKAAKMLVEKNPYLLFIPDKQNFLPIHRAIFGSHDKTFFYLLEVTKRHIELSRQGGYHSLFKGINSRIILTYIIGSGHFVKRVFGYGDLKVFPKDYNSVVDRVSNPTSGIRVRLGPVVVWMVFPRLDPGQWYEKGGTVAIVEGEAHGGLGLRGRLLGVQTQSHTGRIIISKSTYKLGGLLLLSSIGFRMKPQLGLYVRLGEMLGVRFSQQISATDYKCDQPHYLDSRWKRILISLERVMREVRCRQSHTSTRR
ncbi:ankyrin repeat-containing protein [Tanacetum coccineum]|uniref:Ankyrin repeat-containing protein n=1 Tax=Tanacetum coccineum TaxID=301880 RepID=A0ABQ4ZWJ8_9ASTR